jgi:hypothetical protein
MSLGRHPKAAESGCSEGSAELGLAATRAPISNSALAAAHVATYL